jgi:hypothetical protein
MRAANSMRRTLPGLCTAGALLLLAGCGGGDLARAAIGRGSSEEAPADSLTVQRVRGTAPEQAPLTVEPGNMWPAEEEETPRATLADPEAAMRGIPEYRPGETLPSERPRTTPPQRRPGSSSLPPPLGLTEPPRSPVAQPQPTPPQPAPRREGRAIQMPDGSYATGTGDTGRVQGFTTQGGGTGTVIDQGATEVIIMPDGRVEQRLRPR